MSSSLCQHEQWEDCALDGIGKARAPSSPRNLCSWHQSACSVEALNSWRSAIGTCSFLVSGLSRTFATTEHLLQAEALDQQLSAIETLERAAPDAQMQDIKALLGRMLFSGRAAHKKVRGTTRNILNGLLRWSTEPLQGPLHRPQHVCLCAVHGKTLGHFAPSLCSCTRCSCGGSIARSRVTCALSGQKLVAFGILVEAVCFEAGFQLFFQASPKLLPNHYMNLHRYTC